MKQITLILGILMLAIASSCTTTPGSQPAINDTFVIDSAQLSTAVALTALQTQSPGSVVPCARAAYEVAAAINLAATNGVSIAQIQGLADSYLTQWKNPWEPVVGEIVNMIIGNIHSQYPATTQPSATILTGNAKQMAIDVSQGVMNACLPYTQGTPTPSATMGVEARRGTSIVVRHFAWN